jgi:hypothetical protein
MRTRNPIEAQRNDPALIANSLNSFEPGKWFTIKELSTVMLANGYDAGNTDLTRVYLLKVLKRLARQGYLSWDKPHTRLFFKRRREVI